MSLEAVKNWKLLLMNVKQRTSFVKFVNFFLRMNGKNSMRTIECLIHESNIESFLQSLFEHLQDVSFEEFLEESRRNDMEGSPQKKPEKSPEEIIRRKELESIGRCLDFLQRKKKVPLGGLSADDLMSRKDEHTIMQLVRLIITFCFLKDVDEQYENAKEIIAKVHHWAAETYIPHHEEDSYGVEMWKDGKGLFKIVEKVGGENEKFIRYFQKIEDFEDNSVALTDTCMNFAHCQLHIPRIIPTEDFTEGGGDMFLLAVYFRFFQLKGCEEEHPLHDSLKTMITTYRNQRHKFSETMEKNPRKTMEMIKRRLLELRSRKKNMDVLVEKDKKLSMKKKSLKTALREIVAESNWREEPVVKPDVVKVQERALELCKRENEELVQRMDAMNSEIEELKKTVEEKEKACKEIEEKSKENVKGVEERLSEVEKALKKKKKALKKKNGMESNIRAEYGEREKKLREEMEMLVKEGEWKLQQMDKELSGKKRMLKIVEMKLKESDHYMEKYKRDYNSTKLKLEELEASQKKNPVNSREIFKLKEECQKYKSEALSAQEDCRKYKREAQSAQLKLEELEAKNSSKDSLSEEMLSLREEMMEYVETASEMKQEVDREKEISMKLRVELKEQESKVANLQETVSKMEERSRKIANNHQATLASLTGTLEIVKSQLREANEQVDELEKENEENLAAEEEDKLKIQKLSKQVHKLKHSVKVYKQMEALKALTSGETGANSSSTIRKVKELKKKNEKYKAKYKMLKSEMENLKEGSSSPEGNGNQRRSGKIEKAIEARDEVMKKLKEKYPFSKIFDEYEKLKSEMVNENEVEQKIPDTPVPDEFPIENSLRERKAEVKNEKEMKKPAVVPRKKSAVDDKKEDDGEDGSEDEEEGETDDEESGESGDDGDSDEDSFEQSDSSEPEDD